LRSDVSGPTIDNSKQNRLLGTHTLYVHNLHLLTLQLNVIPYRIVYLNRIRYAQKIKIK